MKENSDVVERLQSLREAVGFQLGNHIIAQRLSENLVLFIVFVSPVWVSYWAGFFYCKKVALLPVAALGF